MSNNRPIDAGGGSVLSVAQRRAMLEQKFTPTQHKAAAEPQDSHGTIHPRTIASTLSKPMGDPLQRPVAQESQRPQTTPTMPVDSRTHTTPPGIERVADLVLKIAVGSGPKTMRHELTELKQLIEEIRDEGQQGLQPHDEASTRFMQLVDLFSRPPPSPHGAIVYINQFLETLTGVLDKTKSYYGFTPEAWIRENGIMGHALWYAAPEQRSAVLYAATKEEKATPVISMVEEINILQRPKPAVPEGLNPNHVIDIHTGELESLVMRWIETWGQSKGNSTAKEMAVAFREANTKLKENVLTQEQWRGQIQIAIQAFMHDVVAKHSDVKPSAKPSVKQKIKETLHVGSTDRRAAIAEAVAFPERFSAAGKDTGHM